MNQLTKQRLGIKVALWVKARQIKDATGWDRNDMQRAREFNWIKWERRYNKAVDSSGCFPFQ